MRFAGSGSCIKTLWAVGRAVSVSSYGNLLNSAELSEYGWRPPLPLRPSWIQENQVRLE